ncbi:heat shock protein 9/12-domain-containing protein [Lactifluus subvellereus]|nr:heat shock protein 9/12-domain-containing protein [Lactifluus subvellereus]
MSDQARQSFTDKATAAVKPDSEKSTIEHIGDKLKGAGDSIASKTQPESHKSTTQQIGDTLSASPDESNASLVDKTKKAMGLGDS